MLRCYDCGRELTTEEAVRRVVVASRYQGTLVSQTARVDLCPDCDAEREHQEAVAAKRRRALWTALLACGGVLAFLFLACVLSMCLWGVFVRTRPLEANDPPAKAVAPQPPPANDRPVMVPRYRGTSAIAKPDIPGRSREGLNRSGKPAESPALTK